MIAAHRLRQWIARVQPGGIQARLIALIVLSLLPLLLLLAWIFDQRYQVRRSMALQTELEVAHGIATTFAAYVEGLHQQNFSAGHAILDGMAGEPEKINRLLTTMADQSRAIRNISWTSPDGTVIASSLPGLVGRNLSVRPYFQEVVAGKSWAIGDLTNQGIATNSPTIAVATGIRDANGVLQGLVVAGIEPDRLNEITFTQQRPDGGAYAIFDRNGSVVYRSPPMELTWDQRANWAASDPLLRAALETGQEQSGLGSLDVPGGEWVSARVPVPQIGYVVGAGRPVELAFEPVLGSLLREALLALAIWCMAFLFALLIAHTISRPLHLLEQDAIAMGTGRFKPRDDPHAPDEVRSLRRTVEQMATALIHRADALRESEATLRESEATLRESEARFRVLFHNRHSPMLLIETGSGQIIDANPAACEFYGWDRDAMMGMKITEINQLAPNMTHQEMRLAAKSGTSKLFHFKHCLASGEIRDVEVSSGPIQINGKDYLFSIIHDITERKRAEDELRQTSALLRALSETTPDPLFAKDLEGRMLWANPATLHAIGKPVEQVLGQTEAVWMDDPALGAIIRENDRRIMETGQTEVVEEIILTPGGPRLHMATKSPLRDEMGQIIGLVGLSHDITERHLAEQEMRERNEGLALLSEAAQELLSGSDPAEILEHIYPRLSELLSLDIYFHYTLSDDGTLLQLSRHAGVPEQHLESVQDLKLGETICGRAARLREPVTVNDVQHSTDPEARLIRSIGITAYACHPLIVQNRLVGALSFGSRTRESFNPQSVQLMLTIANLLAAAIYRRQADDTLHLYANKLEESNRELQSFAFIASHDLQEPLRKVESFGGLLLRDSTKLDEHQRDYLERMRQAAGRMRLMVMDLLELSRISTKGKPFETVDLNKVTQEVLSDLEVQMIQTGGTVSVQPLPEIQADPTQMRQLMQNLIGNALKYHRQGSPPVVHVSSSRISGSRVEIRVADNGIGFDPSQTERIFQPFQRLVGRSEYAGTGIGLAICRKITERHHGIITAESVPGEGTVFIVQLPARQPKENR